MRSPSGKSLEIFRKRRGLLKEEIIASLDFFLIGTVAKSPAMKSYGLSTKVEGKTVSLHVRKDIVNQALAMAGRYKKMWGDIQKLSKLNWEILKLENE